MWSLCSQSRVCASGLAPPPCFIRDTLRVHRADLMRLPSYEAMLVKRLSSLLIQGGLLFIGQVCFLPTSYPDGSTDPAPRSRHAGGRAQGGGTILSSGALEGPRQTTARRQPWMLERAASCEPTPLSSYAGAPFNAAPSGIVPSRQKRHRATKSFRARATIITLRVRPPAACVRGRNHAARALSGW